MNLHNFTHKLSKLRNHIVADLGFLQTSHGHSPQERAAIRELSAMSDRDLHDLGIYRADIGQVVRSGRA